MKIIKLGIIGVNNDGDDDDAHDDNGVVVCRQVEVVQHDIVHRNDNVLGLVLQLVEVVDNTHPVQEHMEVEDSQQLVVVDKIHQLLE